MEDSTLKILQNCYDHSLSLVIVMDMDWQIIWSNRKHHHVQYLPQQLGIPTDHKENSTHLFTYDGILQECRLLCNPQDGYRIAEIFPHSQSERTCLQMDVDAITASVQSMTSACQALYNELDELELYDQTSLLNTMIGNCYRIYRMAYLQKELDRLQTGKRRSILFSVNTALKNLYEKCHAILRVCADVALESCSKQIYLQGDMDEFLMAALSAITLCCKKSDCYQSLQIALTAEGELACLQIRTEQTNAELPEHIRCADFVNAGDCEGERALLTLFCQQHGGKWIFAEQTEEQANICRIFFEPHSGTVSSLTLNSPHDIQEGKIYNKYATMLSCIHYRKMF